MRQLLEYKTFIDHGKGGAAATGYKKIKFDVIYKVKHYGSYKARLEVFIPVLLRSEK
jgi:hypothetical protein